MQNKLNQDQIEIIRKRYHDHPLLKACRKAFGCYEAEMESLLFAPEEIFLEAAMILDEVLTEPEDAKQFVDERWNELKTKIRYWDKNAPQEDLNKICGAILCVVAAVLCQHHHHFFNDELKDMVLGIARKKMPSSSVEEERVILELSNCADELFEWLSDYCESEDCLSEEIVNCIQKPKSLSKKEKTQAHTKTKNETIVTQTFEYNKDGIDTTKNTRLTLVFNALKTAKLIAQNADQKQFLEIFYGGQSHVKIAWTGKKNMLHYVFNEWINERKYVKKPTGIGLWQLVAGRFILQKTKGTKTESITLNADELKDAKPPKNIPDDIETLLEMLNPNFGVRGKRNTAFSN